MAIHAFRALRFVFPLLLLAACRSTADLSSPAVAASMPSDAPSLTAPQPAPASDTDEESSESQEDLVSASPEEGASERRVTEFE